MSNNKALENLQQDLEFYKEAIQEVSKEIIESGISKYPVFIAHKGPSVLGRLILNATDFEAHWDISASLLEELVNKNIVAKDKVETFTDVFKSPETHMCVFALLDGEGKFAFYPYVGKSSVEDDLSSISPY